MAEILKNEIQPSGGETSGNLLEKFEKFGEKPADIRERSESEEGNPKFVFTCGSEVVVTPHIVSIASIEAPDGKSFFTNAGVDYYYDSERGYSCKDEEDVAFLFHDHSCPWCVRDSYDRSWWMEEIQKSKKES